MNDLQAVLSGSLVSAVLSQQDKRIKVVQAAGLCVFKKTQKKKERKLQMSFRETFLEAIGKLESENAVTVWLQQGSSSQDISDATIQLFWFVFIHPAGTF